jgi:multidrug efflux pump subunit AcrA (membrane-fusion protein)
MEADLVAAEHAVTQMEQELAMVTAELGYTRSVFARTERLFATGAVSRQELENDRTAAAAGDAKRDAAVAKIAQARAAQLAARKKLEAAESMVAQARAAVGTASIVRGYAEITAPSSGYVVKRLVAPGVLVQPGMAILKTAQIDRVRLQANVGEKDLASIQAGSAVKVTTTTTGLTPTTARVTAVFPFVEQGPRTAVVEAVVDNPDRRMLPGQYVAMEFVTGERTAALTVPAAAVSRLGPDATVWVVKEDRVEPRPVTTGLQTADRVEMVRGLGAGERVVVQGREGLYAGARVVETAAGTRDTPPSDTRRGDGQEHPAPAPTPAAPKGKESGHAGH